MVAVFHRAAETGGVVSLPQAGVWHAAECISTDGGVASKCRLFVKCWQHLTALQRQTSEMMSGVLCLVGFPAVRTMQLAVVFVKPLR